jgi:hypothetical protein
MHLKLLINMAFFLGYIICFSFEKVIICVFWNTPCIIKVLYFHLIVNGMNVNIYHLSINMMILEIENIE